MDTWRWPTVCALRLAGVTRQTLDPPGGGVIVRDPKLASQTGILKDCSAELCLESHIAIELR